MARLGVLRCSLLMGQCPRLVEITDENVLAKLRKLKGQCVIEHGKSIYGPGEELPVYWCENLPDYEQFKRAHGAERQPSPPPPESPEPERPGIRGATVLEDLRSHAKKTGAPEK
jgi:hypothetical protein